MVKASTRSQRGNDKTSPSKARGPSHCRICPGRPLRAECEHTKAGRELLEKRKQRLASPKTPRASPRCTTCEGRPLRSQCIHTNAGQAYLREQEIFKELTLDTQPPEAEIESSPPPTQSTATSSPIANGHLDGGSDELGDSNTNGMDGDAADTGNGASISASSISTNSTRSDYIRPTKTNPRFGWVKGAGRGSEQHQIFRHHPLPSPVADQKTASRRFLENVNRLVEKCEDLANMTGCWLFLGAQHSSGLGSTIHYTSPRLARDAPEQIGEILGDFHALTTQLLQSRRTDALALQRQLQQAEERTKEIEERNQEISQNNGMLTAKVDKMEQVLHVFAERLGVDPNELSRMTS